MTGRRTDPAPYFRAHVFCCVNQRATGDPRGCCASKGAGSLRDYMKKKARQMGLKSVRVNQAGCLDRCELGPAIVIYPEGIWYTARTEADIDAILEAHLRDGGRAETLMLRPDQKEPAR